MEKNIHHGKKLKNWKIGWENRLIWKEQIEKKWPQLLPYMNLSPLHNNFAILFISSLIGELSF